MLEDHDPNGPTTGVGFITGQTVEEIAASLAAAIRSAAFASGASLPTIRSLADRLGVNRNTVASAYRQLSEAGLIEGRGRQGSRVAKAAAPTPRSRAAIRDVAGGNPDYRLLPDLQAVLPQLVWRHCSYQDPPEHHALIEMATAQFEQDGIPVGELSLANGMFHATANILQAVFGVPARVAVEDPCFLTTVPLLRRLGHAPVPMSVDDEGVQPDALARALRSGVDAVIVTPRAQNPFGGSFSEQRAKDLQDLLSRHQDVLVIEDDYFAPLSRFAPVTLVTPGRPKWAVIRSLSKYAGPDLRLAFVNASRDVARSTGTTNALTHRWVSGLLQRAALAILKAPGYTRTIRHAADAYCERRTFFLRCLAELGIEAHGADGFNVWIPVGDESLVTRRLMEEGWLVRPGADFGSDADAVRVTTSALDQEDAHELAGLLADALSRGAVQRGV